MDRVWTFRALCKGPQLAEGGVLGGMLLPKDAIADVVEILKTHDFYRPVHATIFDTILGLYGRGEPADGVTVAAALADSGDLQRIGGVPYLHTLIESVPTAENATYYARIVSERAVLRRLVEAGTKIVQLGYGAGRRGGRDVDDIVDLAQQAVYDVTERRVSEDFAVLADMLQPTLDEIEAVGATQGMMTGFSHLDRLLNGLHPGRPGHLRGRAAPYPFAPGLWHTRRRPGVGSAAALRKPGSKGDGPDRTRAAVSTAYQGGPTLDTVTTGQGLGQLLPEQRSGVAKAALVAGGGFATTIATILGAAGLWGIGDRTILHALVALCVVAALTMFTAAVMIRR